MAEKKTKKQYFGFMLGQEEFNAPISLVQEIVEIPKITYVPNVRDYVMGVMNLRGRVVPVVDLKKRLELGQRNITIESRVIVCKIKTRTVGFVVDAITEVFELADEQIELPSEMFLARKEGKFIAGVSKLQNRLPILLDIPKIFEQSKSEYAEKKKNVLNS
jgi:purine-binding chemotaxis protein CheW